MLMRSEAAEKLKQWERVFELVWCFLWVWGERRASHWVHDKERFRPPPVEVEGVEYEPLPYDPHAAHHYVGWENVGKCTSIGIWACEKPPEHNEHYYMQCVQDYNMWLKGAGYDTLHPGDQPVGVQTVAAAIDDYGAVALQRASDDDVEEGYRHEVFGERKWWLLPLPFIWAAFELLTEDEGFDPDNPGGDLDVWPTYEEWRASLTPGWHREGP